MASIAFQTMRPRHNGRYYAGSIVKIIILHEINLSFFFSNFPVICYHVSSQQYTIIGSDDGLAPCGMQWFAANESQLAHLGLALLMLSWDKNWDSHSLVNGYPSFYPRIALVAPSPECLDIFIIELLFPMQFVHSLWFVVVWFRSILLIFFRFTLHPWPMPVKK